MVAFLAAVLLAAVCTGLLVRWLPRWNLVDAPNARSSHVATTPRGGGLAIVAATITVAVVEGIPGGGLGLVVPALGFAVALGALGLADDRFGLSPKVRLALQCGLGFALAPFLGADLPLVAVAAMAVFATVVVVNAVNFMDGVNGITAIAGSVAFASYAWYLVEVDERGLAQVCVIMTGALLGFLIWNARGAIFLGDVGSYFVGAWWAAIALVVTLTVAEPLLAVAPLTVYVADVGWALIKKARAGERLMGAHRRHVYQRLTDSGRGHLAVSVTVGIFTALASAGAWCATVSGVAWLGWLWLAFIAIGYLALPKLVHNSANPASGVAR